MDTPVPTPKCPVHDKPLTYTSVKKEGGRTTIIYTCPDGHTVQKVTTPPPPPH